MHPIKILSPAVALLLIGCGQTSAPAAPAAPTATSAAATVAAPTNTARPSPEQAIASAQKGTLLLDVRTPEEWQAGHAMGAQWLPLSEVAEKATSALPNKQAPIITYCVSGGRAEKAAEALRAQGYTHVTAMTDGVNELASLGYIEPAQP